MGYIDAFLRSYTRFVDRMEYEHFVAASIFAVLFGMFCMRGYGSRTDY